MIELNQFATPYSSFTLLEVIAKNQPIRVGDRYSYLISKPISTASLYSILDPLDLRQLDIIS